MCVTKATFYSLYPTRLLHLPVICSSINRLYLVKGIGTPSSFLICEQALPGNAREIIQVVRKLSIRDKTFTGMSQSAFDSCFINFRT